MRTTVAGIPCLITDIHISGHYIPARINCEADYSHDAEWPEIEFTVADRRGRPAPWLERKLSLADITRIESEILEQDE